MSWQRRKYGRGIYAAMYDDFHNPVTEDKTMGNWFQAMAFGLKILPEAKAGLEQAQSADSPGGKQVTIEEIIHLGVLIALRAAKEFDIPLDVVQPEKAIDPDTVKRIQAAAKQELPTVSKTETVAPVSANKASPVKADADAK